MENKYGKQENLIEQSSKGFFIYIFWVAASGYISESTYDKIGNLLTFKDSYGKSMGFDKPKQEPKQETNEERKDTPVFSGVLAYFPDALKEVAKCSFAGQQQHNPDKPLAWDRSKSGNEYDSLTRHLLDSSKEDFDTDGTLHKAKIAWRALAGLQKHLENVK